MGAPHQLQHLFLQVFEFSLWSQPTAIAVTPWKAQSKALEKSCRLKAAWWVGVAGATPPRQLTICQVLPEDLCLEVPWPGGVPPSSSTQALT